MQHSLFASAENVVPFASRGSVAKSETQPGPGPYEHYVLGNAYDEMFTAEWGVRPHYSELHRRVADLSAEELRRRQQACEQSFLHQGITFTVYGNNQSTERIIPTDLLPRIITAPEWALLETGLKQRIQALNMFLHDVYSDGRVLKDGLVPRSLIYGSKHYRREMRGLPVPHGAYVNVCGTDLVRREDGTFVVLEDNLRVPSGVSYMLANRDVVRRAFPAIFRSAAVRPIEHYPQDLLATLRSLAPTQDEVSIAVLSPGVFNSAYFEHAFLARQMGVELVEGRDLVVNDNIVYARTTSGLKRVDVIYRRIDDDFIDPLAFRADSTLGVPGVFNAYRAGNVVLERFLEHVGEIDRVLHLCMGGLGHVERMPGVFEALEKAYDLAPSLGLNLGDRPTTSLTEKARERAKFATSEIERGFPLSMRTPWSRPGVPSILSFLISSSPTFASTRNSWMVTRSPRFGFP